jgi:glycosyltransferase involved in cell wall biosynthesis
MTPPRHILMTADTVGGVWTYAVELSRGLIDQGIRISLATMGAPLSSEQIQEVRFRGIQVYQSSYKLEWMDDPWADVDAAGEWLLDLNRRLEPDLIHLNNFAHGNLAWHAPVLMVGHSCVYSWWHAVHGNAAPSEWIEYRRRVREGLQAADMVVGVSRSMLRELERWYGGVRAGCVIYNGRDAGAYEPAQKEDFVFSTGRVWDAAKNIAALDSAAPLVKWPIYVAGEAQHPEGGRSLLRHVFPVGKLSGEEIRPWFSRAGIYSLPALYEPFGISILEAALSGCALVLGDIPSLREIWGDAAIFVPSSDHEALALILNTLISRRSVREEFGRRARARALSFTSDRMIHSYLGLYPQTRARYGAAKEARTSCVS